MAVSVVSICNLALAKLGAYPISSLTEQSKEARLCNVFYEQLRDEVLRAHPWNFAEKRATLALTDTTDFGYSYAYALPSDCIACRYLSDSTAVFSVVGTTLQTDDATGELVYTARITDPTYFDNLFIGALAARLAAELAQPMTGDRGTQQAMWTLYGTILQVAHGTDSGEGKKDADDTNPWVSARLI